MRHLFLALCLASPASAWEFTPSPVCTLAQDGAVSVEVTYDAGLYAIALIRAEGWPSAPVFQIRFAGPASRTITTDRHVVRGQTLTVEDRGFGNVLKGLEANVTAYAVMGDLELPFALRGAAPEVQKFRDCTNALAV